MPETESTVPPLAGTEVIVYDGGIHAMLPMVRILKSVGGIPAETRGAGVMVHAWAKRGEEGGADYWPAGFWVLSSASVLYDASEISMMVWTGEGVELGSAVGMSAGWRTLGPIGFRIYVHPLFDPRAMDNDVALVRVLLLDGSELPGLYTQDPATLPILDVLTVRQRAERGDADQFMTAGFATGQESPEVQMLRYTTVSLHAEFLPAMITTDTTHLEFAEDHPDGCLASAGAPVLLDDKLVGLYIDPCGDTTAIKEGAIPAATAVSAFAGPPADVALLRADSVWRAGITGTINALSPTAIRTLEPRAGVVADITDQEREGNEWVRDHAVTPPHAQSTESKDMMKTLMIMSGVFVGGLVVIFAAYSFFTRNKSSAGDSAATN